AAPFHCQARGGCYHNQRRGRRCHPRSIIPNSCFFRKRSFTDSTRRGTGGRRELQVPSSSRRTWLLASSKHSKSLKKLVTPVREGEDSFHLEISVGSLVSALLGVKEYETRWIGWAGVNVSDGVGQKALTKALAEMFPFGIDSDRFIRFLKLPEVQEHMKELKERFSGRKVMLGVDHFDMIKGIPQKILAFEKFLEEN
ncbi:hypothetical protein S245_055692, partial [Arachis hypogaea]